MRQVRFIQLIVPLLLLAVAISGCELDSGPADGAGCEGTATKEASGNAATLTGCPVGSGTNSDPSTLRRSFDVAAITGLTLGKLHLVRDKVDDTTLRWILPVSNASAAALGNFEVKVEFLDTAGTTLATDSYNRVTGDLMKGETSHTNNALKAGSSGFTTGLFFDKPTLFADAKTVKVTIKSDAKISDVTGAVEVVSYKVEKPSVFDTTDVEITIKNTGTTSITFESLSLNYLFLLDEEGAPLTATSLSMAAGSGTITVAAGGTTTVRSLLFGYAGKATAIRAYFDFEPAP